MNTQPQPAIDTRIIKTRYKNHELLARYWNGRYRGRIWKNNTKLADYNGDNIDLILESLVQIVDQLRNDQFEKRANKPIELDDYIEAWRQSLPSVNGGVVRALTLLAKASQRSAPLSRLIKMSSCFTVQAFVNSLEAITSVLSDELLIEYYKEKQVFRPLYSLTHNDSQELTPQTVLTLDPQWAEAIIAAQTKYQEEVKTQSEEEAPTLCEEEQVA